MVVRAFLLALVFLFAPNSALGKRRATHGSKQLTLRSSTDIEQSQGAEAEFVVSTGLLIWAAVEVRLFYQPPNQSIKCVIETIVFHFNFRRSRSISLTLAYQTYKAFDAASYRNDFKNSLVSNIDVALSDQPANDELSTACKPRHTLKIQSHRICKSHGYLRVPNKFRRFFAHFSNCKLHLKMCRYQSGQRDDKLPR